MTETQKDLLLKHLESQYKIYREEIRVYLGFSAASTTLLAILLFTEFTAARGSAGNPGDPRLYILIPISVIWYGAVLALFLSNVSITAKYSELIEQKINTLLKDEAFQFESGGYIFPSGKGKEENAWYIYLLCIIGVIPIGCALYAEYKAFTEGGLLSSSFGIGTLICISAVLFALEFFAVYRIRKLRRQLNNKLFDEWKRNLDKGESLND